MLKRLYVHNYKAFQNFTVKFDNYGSLLFLGKNGVGKSSLVEIFRLFQKIGEGKSHMSELLDKNKFHFSQPEGPLNLELEVNLSGDTICYSIIIDCPNNFDYCRVIKEQLTINNINVLDREEGGVIYRSTDNQELADFFLDWHMIALPILNPRKKELEIIQKFKNWLANIITLSPIPAFMTNNREKISAKPNYFADNINSWITKLFSEKPRSYQYIYDTLKIIFPDLEEIDNSEGEIMFKFKFNNYEEQIKFSQLSYGERIFVLWSAILASVNLGQVSICVWDEPDNYISLLEIQHYFQLLRKTFKNKALFIATTHNPETMRMFSLDEMNILSREHHLQPVKLRTISDMDIKDDVVENIMAGIIEL